MEIWVVIFMSLCALFACWAFSLVIRSFSDWMARRKKRLCQTYTKRARRIALILFVLCLLSSAASFYGTYTISDAYGGYNNPITNPFLVISLSVILFAVLLCVFGAVGDRARGRLRCPRCWYDMQGTVDPRCPECGKEFANPKLLKRARRPKWMFGLAIVFIAPAGIIAYQSEKLNEYGIEAAIPNIIFTSGWRSLPEKWILGTRRSYGDHRSLLGRIKNRRLRDEPLRRFAEKLADPIADDPLARWNHRRIKLLNESSQRLAFTVYQSTPDAQQGSYVTGETWYPSSLDIDRFLLDVSNDVADAIIAVEHDRAETIDLIVFDSMWEYNTLSLAEQWFAYREISEGRITADEYENTTKIQGLIAPKLDSIAQRFDEEDMIACLFSEEDNIVMYAFLLGYYSGTMDKLIQHYTDAINSSQQIQSSVTYRLPYIIGYASDETSNRFHNEMLRWARDGTAVQRDVCTRYFVRLNWKIINNDYGHDPDNVIFHEIELELLPDASTPSGSITVDQIDLASLMDEDGSYLLPIAARVIKENQPSVFEDLEFELDDVDLGLWVEHIAPVIAQAGPEIILQILDQVPFAQSVEEAQKLNSLLDQLELLENEEILEAIDLARVTRFDP
jgi:hypothetical protein